MTAMATSSPARRPRLLRLRRARQPADVADRGRAVSLFAAVAGWLEHRTGFRISQAPARRAAAARHRLVVHAGEPAAVRPRRPGRDRHRARVVLRTDTRSRVGQRAVYHEQRPRRRVPPRTASLGRVAGGGRGRDAHGAACCSLAATRSRASSTGWSAFASAGHPRVWADRLPAALGSARLLGDRRDDQHRAADAGAGEMATVLLRAGPTSGR